MDIPFKGPNSVRIFESIMSKKLKLKGSKDLIDLLKRMLEINPEKRITMDQILNHK